MKDYEINIRPNGVSIRCKKTRTLYDAEGNAVEIEEGNQRVALGLGDIAQDPSAPTQAELEAFRAKVDELAGEVLGRSFAQVVADARAVQDERDALKSKVLEIEKKLPKQEEKRGVESSPSPK